MSKGLRAAVLVAALGAALALPAAASGWGPGGVEGVWGWVVRLWSWVGGGDKSGPQICVDGACLPGSEFDESGPKVSPFDLGKSGPEIIPDGCSQRCEPAALDNTGPCILVDG